MEVTVLSVDIAKVDRMAQSGSSLLRLIQNDELPILDLLVRESLQNSLDAKQSESTHVNVDLSIKNFKKENVLRNFEGMTGAFDYAFPSSDQKSLVIRDSNTVGLTGPLSYEEMESREEQGNMLNLVYEIGRPQDKAGAGGSWGLGKTVYFRAGVGLVIYYSRILKEDGSFESRLAACLIEDEKKEEKYTFIPYSSEEKLKRGIAWWGVPHHDKTLPLTNEEDILNLLKDFNVEPYTGEETGTTVIIPFIREDNLLTEEVGDNHQTLPWYSSIEKYLNVSVQRWYAPRLDNPYYPHGGWLQCSVNNEEITKNKMEPAFKVLQSLYNRTLDVKQQDDVLKDSEVYIESINTRNALQQAEAGKISLAVVKRDKLRMTVPDNLASPYKYFDIPNISEFENSPIISYTRKPGMIVSYNTSGSWVDRIPAQNEEEFLIGVFVPNSNNPVTDKHFKDNAPNLEAYLRKSEKADHRSWADYIDNSKSLNLVSRIQTTMTRKINQVINKDGKDVKNVKDKQLSSVIGKALLPPRGYGKSSGRPPSGKPSGGGRKVQRTKNFDYTIDQVKAITLYQTEIQISIKPKKDKLCRARIEVAATAERDTIRADKWESEDGIGTSFPFTIEDIVMDGEGVVKEVLTVESGQSYAEELLLQQSEDVSCRITVKSEDPLIQMKILMDDLSEEEPESIAHE